MYIYIADVDFGKITVYPGNYDLWYESSQLDEIRPSNRKYPYADFKPNREPGKEILQVKNISKTINEEKVLDNGSFTVKPKDKIAFLADNENVITILFQIIEGELEPDEGEIILKQTVTNRIIDIKQDGKVIDREVTYNEYLGVE